MNLRRIRFLLWLTSGLATLVAISVVAWSILSPVQCPQVVGSTGKQTAMSDRLPQNLPPLSAFEPVCGMDLRRPLFDPPPVVQAVAKPTLNLKLAGTIVDPGYCQAVLISSDGKKHLAPVGKEIGGARILEIQKDSIKVLFNGETVVLKVEGSPRG